MKRIFFTILFIFAFSFSYSQEIRIIEGIKYHLKDTRYYSVEKYIKISGKVYLDQKLLYKETYWLEGNGKDTNGDGKIENKTLNCLMKKIISV